MIKVKVEKLQKSFGSLEVLKGIDLEVKEGEVVCLIGPSGSGKSTFLRCLNRLEETTAGTVIVDDNDITDPKCNINKVRENIGMVFQQFNLFPHLSVLENIMLAPVDRKKMTKAEAKQTAERLLATVGLAEKAGEYPPNLSGGQQQRVAIARALAMNPDIMQGGIRLLWNFQDPVLPMRSHVWIRNYGLFRGNHNDVLYIFHSTHMEVHT